MILALKKPNWTTLRQRLGYSSSTTTKTHATNTAALGSFHLVVPGDPVAGAVPRTITLPTFASAQVGRTTTLVNRCPFAITVAKGATTNRFFGMDKSILIAPEGYVTLTEIANNQVIVVHGKGWSLV